jgi:hypothetical protein
VYARSLAGADSDVLYQGFAVDMLGDDGDSPGWFFQVKIRSPGTEAIRRWHTYPPFGDNVLFAAVHKAGECSIF